jgi:hypothetical protein
MRILFHLPTRSRPDKAKQCIQNILDYIEDNNFIILVTCDLNDDKMNGFEFKHPKVLIHWGHSNNKIHACNRSIHIIENWDILVNTSDDMQFLVKGFDNKIREAFTEVERVDAVGGSPSWHYEAKKDLDKLVHFNDGNQRDNVCTLPIIGKDYYKLDGYVYHPDYKSLWCDNEQTDVAKIRGKYKYMGHENIIFRHMHPAWNLGQWDEQYRQTESLFHEDKEVYNKHKANNFGL